MNRRLAAASAAAVACVALAAPAVAGAATKLVYVGPVKPLAKIKGVPKDADINGYLPGVATVRRGDSVKFIFNGFHNVYFPAAGETPPGLVTPDPAHPVSGRNDAAGRPFWFSATSQPSLPISAAVAVGAGGKTYDGTKAAGAPAPLGAPTPYTLKFTRTGVFAYYCSIHPGMRGVVRVVSAKSKKVLSKKAYARSTARQFAKAIAGLKKLNKTKAPTDVVRAGVDSGALTLLRFLPAKKSVKVGTTVTFSMSPKTFEAHTISFGDVTTKGGYLQTLAASLFGPRPGGLPGFELNPVAVYPSDPPNAPLPPYDGTNHGNGFENSGIIDGSSATPFPNQAKFTFSKVGAFKYMCLIHPNMVGEIDVTA
jgi:plastocyanin